MKQNLARLALGITIGFLYTAQLTAAPGDYGRDYILRGENQFATFLMVIAAIGMFIFLICIFVSMIYTKIKRGTDVNDDKERQYSRYGCVTCPACKGKGWVKGKEIPLAYPWSTPPSGKHECQRCKGFGRVLTPKAEYLITEIQAKIEQYNKDKEERAKEIRNEENKLLQKKWEEYRKVLEEYRKSGKKYFNPIEIQNMSLDDCWEKLSEYTNKKQEYVKHIMDTISNAPSCTHCGGNDKFCQYCKGFGKIFNTKAEALYIELLNICEERKLFFDGVKILKHKELNSSITPLPMSYSYELIKLEILNKLNKKERRMFLSNLFFSSLQEKLAHEIENAKDCPDCYGTGEIVDYEMVVENKYDDITKMDYNRYYKKKKCKTCNGTGYVQLNS